MTIIFCLLASMLCVGRSFCWTVGHGGGASEVWLLLGMVAFNIAFALGIGLDIALFNFRVY